jgi:malic enzyme
MDTKTINEAALAYHAQLPAGKLGIHATKPVETQYDLSLAYSPGVAAPCLEIAADKSKVYDYTAKGNLVAIISNGTAVLGLGNIGPEASKPVMEGKAILLKKFAGIDAFDIELDATKPDDVVNIIKAISPTFGAINLEDFKAPECFEIEQRLQASVSIPIMHDDQHGTAMVISAALENSLRIVKKKIQTVKIVISGAGAAAIACGKLLLALGAQLEHIIMCDSKGVIGKNREGLTIEKQYFATDSPLKTLQEAIKDADVFIGLSQGNVLQPQDLLHMADSPIVFALANPTPEIDYELAINTRKDIIMATGRSDYPNQINNVLCFPYIYRGALDVQATAINDAMKLAVVQALASLAQEPVPTEVLKAYNISALAFGPTYIVPKPIDPRLIVTISSAVAKAAIASGVARKPIQDWAAYADQLQKRLA